MPKVSVIIPTYNRAHFVSKAIQSVLDQNFDDLEVVVVDDGSTDNTREVVSYFADRPVVYIYQENRGATAAFNRGIAESTGEYVSVLGSDDWYLPDGLVPVYKHLEQHPEFGAVSGGFVFVDEAGNFMRESRPWEAFPNLDTETWLFWCPTILQSSLVRREWIALVSGFDPNVRCVQDWDFGLRLAYAGCQMAWIEESVFCYRLHQSQISRDATSVRQDYQVILSKFFGQTELPGNLLAMKDRAFANVYAKGAMRAFEAGQWQEGGSDLEQAIRRDPSLLDRRGQRIFELLVGWAADAQTSDPGGYIAGAFRSLPSSAKVVMRGRRRAALAALAMAEFFGAYERGDASTVRRAFIRGISQDPSWLRNRGVLSIALRSFGGSRVLSLGRHLPKLRLPAGV